MKFNYHNLINMTTDAEIQFEQPTLNQLIYASMLQFAINSVTLMLLKANLANRK